MRKKAAAPASMTQAEFARRRGVSRKTVTTWKGQGKLVLTADGRVDVVATEARLADQPETYRGGTASKPPPAARVPPAAAEASTQRPARSPGPLHPQPHGGSLQHGKGPGEQSSDEAVVALLGAEAGSPEELAAALGWKTVDATRVKEIYLALKRKREHEQETGKLVPIEDVALQVEKEYGLVRERLLTIPGKLAAQLVGRDQAQIEAALLEEVTEALNELHDPAGAAADRSRSPAGAAGAGEEGV